MTHVRHWLWFFDDWLICAVTTYLMLCVIVAMILTGMVQMVHDPLAAVRSQRQHRITDFSVGIVVQVLPGHPLGIELRKTGEDEGIQLFEPHK